MGPLPCFVLCLLGDCGKIFIFAIFAKLAYVRQRSSGPYTALCFVSLSIMAKLSFSPYLPNSPLSPTFMGPLHCFVFCLVGDCDKIVFFVIFAKFAFFSKLLWGTFTALCFASLAILPKLSFSTYLPKLPLFPTFMGPLYCFVPCLVGDCSKIVIFAIFAKFAAFANFCGTPIPLRGLPRCWLWQNYHFHHNCKFCHFCQPLWGPYTALCLASLAIVAKLSFSPYLPNLPLSPTFMGPLFRLVICLVADCGKIAIFAIFAKFATFANIHQGPILLCALPHWRLWQNCHFRHICQIRRFRQRLWAPFTALCFASFTIVSKLSFLPYLPNSPLSPTFMGPVPCFVFCLVGDCGKIVSFAIFAKFAAFANFYGAPIPLSALPRWRLWQNCHFRHISQIRRFRQLLWGPFTALCFASLAIVAKLSFSPYLTNSSFSPTFMGFLHCFVLCLLGDCGKIVIFNNLRNLPLSQTFMGPVYFLVLCSVCDCGKIVIFAIFAKFAAFANFYVAPTPLCALHCWGLWQNCHFRHIWQMRCFRQL